ncbi:MAG TPA: hypothetical protein VFT75_04740 [Nocardioidaceae bacterium]|jgi:hypothetical protein|nr:hypothetical protein [Nocardioidaceae bacterium]
MRRLSLRLFSALTIVVATVTTGCSASSTNASCVGIIVLHGHRYYPWSSTQPLTVAGEPIPARLPNCHDNPYDNAPDATIQVHKIRGINANQAVVGQIIQRPPHGRRIIYVRAAPSGHTDRLPQELRGLVQVG